MHVVRVVASESLLGQDKWKTGLPRAEVCVLVDRKSHIAIMLY